VKLTADGNLQIINPAGPADITSRNSTIGPLTRANLDASSIAAARIPLLGDGSPTGTLTHTIGPNGAGDPVVQSFTDGPRLRTTLTVPSFPPGTPRPTWWTVWNDHTLQDYRGFAPIHRRACNILFADGSVRSFNDQNKDGFLNNGFEAIPNSGFANTEVEVPEEEMESRYSLSESIAR
jgi:prepilin-type processing-associated H-X9-DG protein